MDSLQTKYSELKNICKESGRVEFFRSDKIDNAIIHLTGFVHIQKKNFNLKNATRLRIVGHHTIKDVIDAVDQNNRIFNSTTFEHQIGKTCSIDFIYFMCLVLYSPFYSCFLYIFHYISIYL